MTRDNAEQTKVVLAHFSTVEEAHMAVAKLDANGVQAEVGPYHMYDQLRFVAAPEGVAVLVDRDHLASARMALEQDEPEAL